MSLIVLYFLHSTSVLSFYIDVVLLLSNRYFAQRSIRYILHKIRNLIAHFKLKTKRLD